MKIDYIIPMVFDNDLKWRDSFRQCHWIKYDSNNNVTRWRSMGTEELLVRCIRAFMPFVGTIHILLARESQKRPWMDNYGIHVVYHHEFIPPQYLPTFNSRTIEMFLHRIPGLQERFIYSNDDMFPVSPMQESDFFIEEGPCLYKQYMKLPKDFSQFAWVCKEETQLLAKLFGVDITEDTWISLGHGVTPMLKSTYENVWDLFPANILGSITRDRDWKNYNQYLFAYYQLFHGSAVETANNTSYADNTMPLADVEKTIMNAKGIVCVNDAIKSNDFEKFTAVVSAAIEKRLQTYLEKTNYGKGTENNTAGDRCADATPVSDKQRRNGGDNTPHEEKIQDQVAEKRPVDKTDSPAPTQEKRGKGAKNNGKRRFRFDS